MLQAAGVREVKNNLSHYVRKVKKGERIAITEHGRVVAELVPPTSPAKSRLSELIARGVVTPAKKRGPIPKLAIDNPMPAGTALADLDDSRNEDHEWP
jgi:prevent-host-death family protein